MLLSTLAGKDHIDTSLMIVRTEKILPLLNNLSNSNSNLGGSSVEAGPRVVEEDGVPTLVFPSPSHINHTNDNYCVGLLDPNFQKTVCSETIHPVSPGTPRSDVDYSVVNCVLSIHSHGPPQKKGVSPGQCLSKIKHVKGVCCVNPCLSVPLLPVSPMLSPDRL